MTPTIFCETVTEKLAPLGVKCKTLGKEFILTEKMGAFWSVAKGSIEEPKMLKLEYNGPTKAGNKKICLVGKGVTFDAGGISIKVNSYECKIYYYVKIMILYEIQEAIIFCRPAAL